MSTSGFSAPRPAHKLRFDARPGCGTPASKNDWGERLPKERLSPCRRWTEVLPDTVAAAWAFRNPLGVGTKSLRFTPLTQAFVAGSKHEFQLGRPRRQVDIHSLKRQNALFSISESSLEGRTRSALDLVASLETGAPGAAIAGGWAAIEAILARPDTQNVEAAADLAVLVACSFPRAELTPFTHAYEAEHQDHLADTLRAATSNRDRCTILGSAIERGETLRFSRPSDQAALERIAQIVRDPRGVLIRVAANVEEAIRRLYRQRNLVLHAGITNSVAMDPTLRTVPPLVGAGFDRLVHDALATG
jgi:hypothetical protein